MIDVLCVLRSGGSYTQDWVRRLRDGVARHLLVPHHFVCLSDVSVPCLRIRLRHDWPGWWSKIEIFRSDIWERPTLYLDLDTVIVGDISCLASLPHDFAMLRGFGRPHYVGSGVMWLGKPQPQVYESFTAGPPERLIAEYARNPGPGAGRHAAYNAARGDQAYIVDAMGGLDAIPRLTDDVPGLIELYGRFGATPPPRCSVVCFKGKRKPDMYDDPWLREHWR